VYWFGRKPFSHACSPHRKLTVAPDAVCNWCDEPITESDDGYATPVLTDHLTAAFDANGVLQRVDLFHMTHYECAFTFGHARCILTHGPSGRCGDRDRDPPGMSKRDAARLAERLGQQALVGQLNPRLAAALFDRFFPGEVRRN